VEFINTFQVVFLQLAQDNTRGQDHIKGGVVVLQLVMQEKYELQITN
jgi:hypothetical protein